MFDDSTLHFHEKCRAESLTHIKVNDIVDLLLATSSDILWLINNTERLL